jgi:tetratricopeptide (TPR) repeat protein
LKAFLRVLELAPSVVAAQLDVANLHLARGNASTALTFLNTVVKARPGWGYPRYLRGQALLDLGDLAGAEAELLAVVKADPKSAEINTSVGRLYAAKTDFARARTYFNRALDLEPDSILALNGLVAADVVEKRPNAARARLDSRLAAKPNDRALLFMAGNTFMTLGDAPRAESLFKKLLELDPASIDAYSRLGTIYVSQNRLDEAMRHFQNASKASPAAAATMIGMILERQNKRQEARQQYERALAIDPDGVVAANNLASMYADAGENLDRALQLAQMAKARFPDRAEVSDTLGWIYFKQGLTTLAIASLREAAKQSPSNPTVHYHLGLSYLKTGDKVAARTSLQQALKLDPAFRDAVDARRILATLRS